MPLSSSTSSKEEAGETAGVAQARLQLKKRSRKDIKQIE
jgi:hypothetical protein